MSSEPAQPVVEPKTDTPSRSHAAVRVLNADEAQAQCERIQKLIDEKWNAHVVVEYIPEARPYNRPAYGLRVPVHLIDYNRPDNKFKITDKGALAALHPQETGEKQWHIPAPLVKKLKAKLVELDLIKDGYNPDLGDIQLALQELSEEPKYAAFKEATLVKLASGDYVIDHLAIPKDASSDLRDDFFDKPRDVKSHPVRQRAVYTIQISDKKMGAILAELDPPKPVEAPAAETNTPPANAEIALPAATNHAERVRAGDPVKATLDRLIPAIPSNSGITVRYVPSGKADGKGEFKITALDKTGDPLKTVSDALAALGLGSLAEQYAKPKLLKSDTAQWHVPTFAMAKIRKETAPASAQAPKVDEQYVRNILKSPKATLTKTPSGCIISHVNVRDPSASHKEITPATAFPPEVTSHIKIYPEIVATVPGEAIFSALGIAPHTSHAAVRH